MSKKLIIAEKPSVAADIARAIGGFEASCFDGEYIAGLPESDESTGASFTTLDSDDDDDNPHRDWT